MEARAAAPERRTAWRVGLVLLVAVVLLVPVWAFPLFPSQDGPSKVANAWTLLSLLTDRSPARSEVYEVNPGLFPNWTSHAILAVLLTFLGPVAAEKVFLTVLVLGVPASFRYALRALRPESTALVALLVPFVYDSSIHLGYYNRGLTLVPFFLSLGFWMRREGRLGAWGTVGLLALLLWLFFSGAVSLALALLGLGLLLAAVTIEEHLRAVPDRGRRLVRRTLELAAASLPALVLLARFYAQGSGGVVGQGPGSLERLRSLATLDLLVSLDARERWLAAALAALVAGALLTRVATRIRRRDWRGSDGLLILCAAGAAGYFLAPAMAVGGTGPWGGTVHVLIAPYVWLVALLWLGAEPLGKRAERVLVISSLAVAIGLLGLRLPRYAELNDHLREYLSVAPWVPSGVTILPVGYAHHGRGEDARPLSHGTWPLRHAADWLVATRDVVSADNYEAEVSFFPVIHRPGYDPYALLGTSLDRLPACVRLARFNRLAPRPAEVVIVWNARWEERDDFCTGELHGVLETRYRRVFVSAPRGQAEVYRLVR